MTSTPISSLRNLGPATEAEFARAGITSAEELRDLGADAAYARVLRAGSRPHFIGFYIIEMALQGRPWNDCKGTEKERLRIRFDALVATNFDRDLGPVEQMMNRIGGVERPPK